MPQVSGCQIWAVRGWVTWVIWCFTEKFCRRRDHELAHCHDEAANHQLPIAAAFWIIQIVSTEECLSLMQNLMHILCSTRSVILHAMATQDTCSLNGIYLPHWLVQWSHHCSHMRIPVYSPWIPGYINVTQTIIIVLTVGGFFLDRPCTYQSMVIWILFAFWFLNKKERKNKKNQAIGEIWTLAGYLLILRNYVYFFKCDNGIMAMCKQRILIC